MKILYIHTSSFIGGGNQVLLATMEKLDRSRFQPVSIIPEPGPLEEEFRRLEVPSSILDLRMNSLSKASLAGSIASLMAICVGYGVDIVHANDPLSYGLRRWVCVSQVWFASVTYIIRARPLARYDGP